MYVNKDGKTDEGGEGSQHGSKQSLDGVDATDKEENKDDVSVESEKNDDAAEEALKFVKSPDEGAVVGLALLDEELFLLQRSSTADGYIHTVEVFDADSLEWKRRMNEKLTESTDMTSSSEHKLLFVSAPRAGFIYVIKPSDDSVRRWSLDEDKPVGLSVTPTTHNLLVTCFLTESRRPKIIEVTWEGQRVREVELQIGIENPWHAVQLVSGQFVVCHGNLDDKMHRICLVNEDGYIEKKFGGRRTTASETDGTTGVSVPWHLAADEDGFVLVADSTNNRVLLLTPEMKFDSVYAKGLPDTEPCRLCLDAPGKRMFVASNKIKDNRFQLGQVAVYDYDRSSEAGAGTNWLTKTAAVAFKK